jgi:phosphoribosylformimino-5-aminoimidazole carboxamide ribotide isomerase
MLIPSIDLMGGRIVQLVQGERKALEFDDIEEWIVRFQAYPIVQLIDLDAAKGNGNNLELAQMIMSRLPCQVGGGLRNIEGARKVLDAGARKLIFGSSLIREGKANLEFAENIAREFGTTRVVAAIDSRSGRVAVHGWASITELSPLEMIGQLDPYCGTYLYTHIDTEGLMKGFPIEAILPLQAATERKIIAAGGVSSWEEIEELDRHGIDAVVGMALYTGKLSR